MDKKKRAKLITLALSAILVIGIAGGTYMLTHTPDAGENGTTDPESSGSTTGQNTNWRSPDTSHQPDNTEAAEDGLLLLNGGIFFMGSPTSERQRQEDELQHEVTVGAFYLDPYEVTQADYQAIMGENPSYFRGDSLPADSVTWYDAIKYCNQLSERHGLTPVYAIDREKVTWDRSANGYRLPTEAEWEYAARAGTTTVFYDGNQITSENANFEGSYPYLIEENYVTRRNPSVVTSTNRGETIPVDSLSPNGFGLYNMYGNVSEWCFDYYGPYDMAQNIDPSGPAGGSLRVNRGGGYNDFAKQLRSAYRSATTPDTTERNLGFRVARNAQTGNGTVETTYSLDIRMPEQPRILVAYFSYSGNTENGARLIAEYTDGDLFEIQMETPYTGNIYEVSQADLNNNVHPVLASHVADLFQYDVIILGYPTWWSTMPMPVFSFLEEYDLTGKIILPFSSNGGTRFGDSISDLSKNAAGAYVGQGFEYEYSGGSGLAGNLEAWLTGNGIGVE